MTGLHEHGDIAMAVDWDMRFHEKRDAIMIIDQARLDEYGLFTMAALRRLALRCPNEQV